MTRVQRALIAALLFAGGQVCYAEAPVYFNVEGLGLAVLAVVLGLFVLIGRMYGVIAFVGLLVAIGLWSEIDGEHRRSRANTARETLSHICLREAGVTGEPLTYKPKRVFILLDKQLRASAQNRLRVHLEPLKETSNVEYVTEMPAQLDEFASYIFVEIVSDAIEGAKGWFVDGLRTTIKDGAGTTVSTFVDFQRDYGWCLGEDPASAIQRFLKSYGGVEVNFSGSQAHPAIGLAPSAAVGTVTAAKSGRFSETRLIERPNFGPKENALLIRRALIPNSTKCRFQWDPENRPVAICREGTPEENRIDVSRLSAVHETATSWFAIGNDHSDAWFFDSFSVVERNYQGAIIGRWYVRIPPVRHGLEDSEFEIRNVSMRGSQLTADMVFSRHIELPNVSPSTMLSVKQTATSPQDVRVYQEWFGNKATISVDLVK